MRSIPVLLAANMALTLTTGCSSTTTINSSPPGADLSMNGMEVGKTPFVYSDKKVLFSKQQVSIEKKGYERFDGFIQRDEIVGGYLVLGVLCLFPLILWSWEYPPFYKFTLRPTPAKSSFVPFPQFNLASSNLESAQF